MLNKTVRGCSGPLLAPGGSSPLCIGAPAALPSLSRMGHAGVPPYRPLSTL